jgi:hypothetical protein
LIASALRPVEAGHVTGFALLSAAFVLLLVIAMKRSWRAGS